MLVAVQVSGWRRRLPSPGATFACGLAFASALSLACLYAGILIRPKLIAFLFLMPLFASLKAGGHQWVTALFYAPRSPSKWDRGLKLLLLILKGIAVLQFARFAGIPLVNYDVLSYHVPLAAKFLSADTAHALLVDPQTFYARLPLGASILESFVTDGTPWGVGIQLLIIASALAGASSASRITAMLGGRQVARSLAATLYLLHPLVVNSAIQGLVDPVTSLFAVAALELLLRFFSRSTQWLDGCGAGILAGFSFATKYSAAGIVVIPLMLAACVYTYRQANRFGFQKSLLRLSLIACGMLLAAAPWLLRAQHIGGSIAFPFGGETSQWTAEQAHFVVNAHNLSGPAHAEYWRDAGRKISTLGFGIPFLGISALLVAGLLTFFSRARLRTAMILMIVALGYAAWLTVRDNPARFLLPSAAFLIPVAALGATQSIRNVAASRALLLALLVCVVWSDLPALQTAAQIDGVYTRRIRREAAAGLIGEGYMSVVNAAVSDSPDGQMLLFFEAKESLFDGKALTNSVWDQPLYAAALKISDSAVHFAGELRGQGFTSIFVNEFEWGRLLDFYARDQFPPGQKHQGNIGITAKVSDDEMMNCLAAYPPHKFAGLDERELQILHDFLLLCRRNAKVVSPAGPGAEIWYAEIPNE
ncbi:MAG: hypothetical protein ABI579_03965 [Candidatus Sumerlaeota bacterium]